MGKCLVALVVTIFFILDYKVVARSPLLIVNGTSADEGEFPYMVQLYSGRTNLFQCGGSILGPEWILTAAHCIGDNEVGSVIYGTNQLYNFSKMIKVKNSLQHPKYQVSGNVPIYDVGIVQLAEPIPLSENVQPIQLAEIDDIPFHIEGTLSGWGSNDTWGDPMQYLQKVNLQLLTDQECSKQIGDTGGPVVFNPTHHLCTDISQGGQCVGDSGSPFVINGTQYGIVSWSYKPCGSSPGAYSRFTNPEYRQWIRNVTNI